MPLLKADYLKPRKLQRVRRELESRKMSANALALVLRTLGADRRHSQRQARNLAGNGAATRPLFGASAMFWLNLQTAYELAVAEEALGERIAEEVKPAAA